MGLLFAYSTDGHKIEEFDFIENIQRTIDRFPSPEELFLRYKSHVFKQDIKSDPLSYPYHSVLGGRSPRYYQEIAIKKIVRSHS